MLHTYRQQTYNVIKNCAVNETVIVMEMCAADLNGLPENDRPIFYDLMQDVVSALKFMSENGQIHGDIKNGNILLKKDQSGKWMAIITDHAIFQHGGTPIFMAPEGLSKQTEKSDIYSLGITILFSALEIPFALELLYFPLRSGAKEASKFVETIPALKLIFSMIDPNPANRPDYGQILRELKQLSNNFTGERIGKSGNNVTFLNDVSNDAILEMNLNARKGLLEKWYTLHI